MRAAIGILIVPATVGPLFQIGALFLRSVAYQRTVVNLAREATGGLKCLSAVRHASEMRLRLEIKQIATRSRSGMNCEQTVMASFMQAVWSSCVPAVAASGDSAMQRSAIASVELVFIAPSLYSV